MSGGEADGAAGGPAGEASGGLAGERRLRRVGEAVANRVRKRPIELGVDVFPERHVLTLAGE